MSEPQFRPEYVLGLEAALRHIWERIDNFEPEDDSPAMLLAWIVGEITTALSPEVRE